MQTTLIVIAIVVVLISLLVYAAKIQLKNTPLVADHEKVLTLTDKNFAQQTKNKVVLIDFWASWCAPCRMMAPVLNEVADNLSGNACIAKVDIEKHQLLANKFNVRSIPTLIILKDGVEIKRFVGIKSKDFLMQQIQNV